MQATEPIPLAAARHHFVQEQDFAARQYRGRRENQEDYYSFADAADYDQPALAKLLLVIGDGLGAHAGGSVASYVTVGAFIKAYHDHPAEPAHRLREALEQANDVLGTLAASLPAVGQPMGTTLVAALVSEKTLQWISVGDSPLFVFRGGRLTRVNADHSLTQLLEERVRQGELTPEEAAHHPDRHTLHSAVLGMPLMSVDAPPEPYPLEKGDIVIGASDGIFTLTTRQIEELLAFGQHTTADKIADAILFAIRRINSERQDNTTVGVVKV
ncbi:MAG: SpoIIE family protein phosphatase [Verrucomicrobiaceae bacterium]|nr:SpoIIE family protein phosphatase [Verrucomicrobiaceae bacterium]